MGKASQALDEAKVVFLALLVIGLIGLLFLIIYGNLSGNLGFDAEGVTITNESGTWINQTGYTLIGAADAGSASFVITQISNSTSGQVLLAANYSVTTTGVVRNASATEWEATNISYTYNRDSRGTKDTDAVITNLTGGATEFFSFANVWFILLAITILIGIVIGVIALVERIGGGGTGDKKGRSEFTT